MSGKIRYSDEFKIDAVAQGTEREYSVKDVAERPVISTKSQYTWMAQFSKPQQQTDQEAAIRRLKRVLARVTEEHDMLKMATVALPGGVLRSNAREGTSPVMQSEVRVCQRTSPAALL
ncbi:transposase [Tateyamaria sp.]|uniref:transposase n=1 Tax=Tateyamaria sp. TaxID=1929288 RepID=UPI0039B95984